MGKLAKALAPALDYIEKDNPGRRPRWKTPTGPDIKRLRDAIGLSQEAFASQYGLNLVSLRKWEQGRAKPEQAATLLLRMAEINPTATRSLIEEVKYHSQELALP